MSDSLTRATPTAHGQETHIREGLLPCHRRKRSARRTALRSVSTLLGTGWRWCWFAWNWADHWLRVAEELAETHTVQELHPYARGLGTRPRLADRLGYDINAGYIPTRFASATAQIPLPQPRSSARRGNSR